jgi:hypothetical protein
LKEDRMKVAKIREMRFMGGKDLCFLAYGLREDGMRFHIRITIYGDSIDRFNSDRVYSDEKIKVSQEVWDGIRDSDPPSDVQPVTAEKFDQEFYAELLHREAVEVEPHIS